MEKQAEQQFIQQLQEELSAIHFTRNKQQRLITKLSLALPNQKKQTKPFTNISQSLLNLWNGSVELSYRDCLLGAGLTCAVFALGVGQLLSVDIQSALYLIGSTEGQGATFIITGGVSSL